MRSWIRSILAGSLFATVGCHYYAAPEAGTPTPGTAVRLELEEPQTVDFSEAALRDIVSVEGPVLSWSPDSVLVSSNWVVSERGSRNRTLGEPVGIATVSIAQVQEQKVHRGRTAALIAGGGLVVGGLFLALFNRDNVGGGAGSGQGAGSGVSGLVPR
jgi:hypothetical protein